MLTMTHLGADPQPEAQPQASKKNYDLRNVLLLGGLLALAAVLAAVSKTTPVRERRRSDSDWDG